MARDQRSEIRETIRDQYKAPARRLTQLGLTGLAMLAIAGCRQDMHNQPKIIPQRESVMFADHRSARPAIENTVARGALKEDSYFYTGVVMGANGYREERDQLPFPVTMTVLEKGQERFNIYCTPCHSRVGNGLGAIVLRGYKPAGNLNDQVRRAQPISHYFYVMTHGYGAMPDYSAQLAPEERWAVAAYIRAIQLSQNATTADVPSGAKVESLKDLLAVSDVVSLHCPLTDETRKMINAATIAQMKRDAILINTARGAHRRHSSAHRRPPPRRNSWRRHRRPADRTAAAKRGIRHRLS